MYVFFLFFLYFSIVKLCVHYLYYVDQSSICIAVFVSGKASINVINAVKVGKDSVINGLVVVAEPTGNDNHEYKEIFKLKQIIIHF